MKKLLIILIFMVNFLLANEVYAIFEVEANYESKLTLASSGIVDKIYVDIGNRVKKGELLLMLENSLETEDVKMAKTQVNLAKIAYEHSLTTYKRYEKIKDVIDEEQLQKYEFDRNLKAKELLKAQNALKLKEIILDKTKLYAPYNGLITKKLIEVGDGVNNTQTNLFSMIDDSNVKLILSFDEKYWNEVKKGQKFKYKVDGGSDYKEGVISKIYPVIEKESRKLKAEVITKDVLVGLFGDGTIVLE